MIALLEFNSPLAAKDHPFTYELGGSGVVLITKGMRGMKTLRVYFIDTAFTEIGDFVVTVPVGDEIDQRKFTEAAEKDGNAIVLGFEEEHHEYPLV